MRDFKNFLTESADSTPVFGVESNFYKEITKNYEVWCDEDFLFRKNPYSQPDNDAADYMLKKGDIPNGYV